MTAQQKSVRHHPPGCCRLKHLAYNQLRYLLVSTLLAQSSPSTSASTSLDASTFRRLGLRIHRLELMDSSLMFQSTPGSIQFSWSLYSELTSRARCSKGSHPDTVPRMQNTRIQTDHCIWICLTIMRKQPVSHPFPSWMAIWGYPHSSDTLSRIYLDHVKLFKSVSQLLN